MNLTKIAIILIFGVMISCKKESNNFNQTDALLSNTLASIKDSLMAEDYENLDLRRSVVNEIQGDKEKQVFIRIPFKSGKHIDEFLLIEKDKNGKFKRGRIIAMKGLVNGSHQYEGEISVSSMSRVPVIFSVINDGYIQAYLPKRAISRVGDLMIVAVPSGYLPEVVIVGTLSPSNAQSWTTWMSLQGLAGTASSGTSGIYASSIPVNGVSGGGSTTTGTSSQTSSVLPEGVTALSSTLQIDFESQYSNPGIDLDKYMRCFDLIADAGATGSIEIMCDLPVDGDPTKIFDWSNGSPGHTFIKLTKKNGSQSISQNIGFYPASGWKTAFTSAPMKGKFVDNEAHEFNASYHVELTASQIRTVITRILYLKSFVQYDIDDYNCTDWSLDVFNSVLSVDQKLTIPHYVVQGSTAPNGTSTPNGLYIKLNDLKKAGGSRAANILIPLVGYTGTSHGECN